MAIDLTFDADVEKLIDRTRTFTREYVLPIEDRFLGNIADAGGDGLRVEAEGGEPQDAVMLLAEAELDKSMLKELAEGNF